MNHYIPEHEQLGAIIEARDRVRRLRRFPASDYPGATDVAKQLEKSRQIRKAILMLDSEIDNACLVP